MVTADNASTGLPDEDRVLYIEDCKHAGPDALIVQRNEGIRWVTCVDCGAEFVREEFYADAVELAEELNAEVEQWRDAVRQHRYATQGEKKIRATVRLWSLLDEHEETT